MYNKITRYKHMKKDFGVKPAFFPQPVAMIATYNKDGSVNLMNMAWGGICDNDKIALNLDENHLTSQNIKDRKAFTISVATKETIAESDYVGLVSGAKDPNKFNKTGFTATKSSRVDAPIVNEYPLTLECEVYRIQTDGDLGFRVIGRIVNILVDESILDEKGKIDYNKFHAVMFDPFNYGYYQVGEKVAQAFNVGAPY